MKLSKIKEAPKKIYDYTAENVGIRGLLIVGIVIGIIILAIGLFLVAQTSIAIEDLDQMNTLGLLTPTQYSYRLNQLQMQGINNVIVGQIGAIITAILLIVAGISPISGKGTPYFSEFVRLGLLVFAAVMLYLAVMI